MDDQITQIVKDIESGILTSNEAKNKLLKLFSPSIAKILEAAEIDLQIQKSYEDACDRKRGFIEGVKWMQEWPLYGVNKTYILHQTK